MTAKHPHLVFFRAARWAWVCCCFFSAVHTLHAESFAIVIGVNECPDFRLSDGSKPRPLRGAESDADAMARTLVDAFHFSAEHVTLLKGSRATRNGIRATLADLAKKARTPDSLVLHFSGHATLVVRRRDDGTLDGPHAALCTYDANDRGENVILGNELGLWLDDIQAGQITLILDCCHAGNGTKEADDDLAPRYLPIKLPERAARHVDKPWHDVRSATKSLSPRKAAFFFACRPEQQAYERRLPGQQAPTRSGQFSYYLLEGLKDRAADANHDGTITNQEALDYATRRLNETFNRFRSSEGERQEPVLEADVADAPLFLGVSMSHKTRPTLPSRCGTGRASIVIPAVVVLVAIQVPAEIAGALDVAVGRTEFHAGKFLQMGRLGVDK